MKKILSITCFVLLVFTTKVNAQNNLTWIVKDNIEDNTFKTRLEFHVAIEGLSNQNEVTNFCNKIKANPEVESCESVGKDANGGYLINLKMKKTNEALYYIGWANKLGISYIVVKGEKKSTAEWAKAERK